MEREREKEEERLREERQQEEQRAAGILNKSIDKNIKDTESLLQSFFPNFKGAMNLKKERSFAVRKERQ